MHTPRSVSLSIQTAACRSYRTQPNTRRESQVLNAKVICDESHNSSILCYRCPPITPVELHASNASSQTPHEIRIRQNNQGRGEGRRLACIQHASVSPRLLLLLLVPFGGGVSGSTEAAREFRGQHLGQAAEGGHRDPDQAAHRHQPGGAVPSRRGPLRAQDGRQALREVCTSGKQAVPRIRRAVCRIVSHVGIGTWAFGIHALACGFFRYLFSFLLCRRLAALADQEMHRPRPSRLVGYTPVSSVVSQDQEGARGVCPIQAGPSAARRLLFSSRKACRLHILFPEIDRNTASPAPSGFGSGTDSGSTRPAAALGRCLSVKTEAVVSPPRRRTRTSGMPRF